MIIFLLSVFTLFFLIVSVKIFKHWFNPLSLYLAVWYLMLYSFHLKLINYEDLSFQTWFVIVCSFLAFFLGIVLARDLRNTSKSKFDIDSIIKGKKNHEIIKKIGIITGIIGLVGAIQHLSVLLGIFGNFEQIVLRLPKIYQMRVKGEIEGVLPYLAVFSYVSVFFLALLSGIKGRISIYSVIPIVAIFLKGFVTVGRASILMGIFEFILVFILVRYYLVKISDAKFWEDIRLKFAAVFLAFSLFTIIFGIKILRQSSEEFVGQTKVTQEMKDNLIFTPTIYMYTSAQIAVLNKFLFFENETYRLGENTFQFFYNFLAKYKMVEKPPLYQKGYYVPMWVNTATILRELINDFGILGTFIFMFILGIFSIFTWNNFFENGNLISLLVQVFLMLIISFSFLLVVTRFANWILSLIFILLFLLWVFSKNEKYAS